jgi:hypothetical protein
MRRTITVIVLLHLLFSMMTVSVLAQAGPSTPTGPPPNSSPIAADDSATTTQGTSVSINVLANDSDPDGDLISVASVAPGAFGTTAINPDQTVLYTPAPDFAGTDSFQYVVTDGAGGSATAQVTVSVEANTPTPVPPTPTDTPAPPTDTPTATAIPPTETPTNTPTPTSTPFSQTLTFSADADARVQEANPTTNYGTSSTLRVDGGTDPDVNSYLRFTVSGVTGTVTRAMLRIYATTSEGTVDGPAIYGTTNNWIESGTGGITWANQPGPTSGAVDDTGAIAAGSLVEFNVTPLVAADGQVSFMLATASKDGLNFYSRQNSTNRPALVVIFDSTGPPNPTSTSVPTATSTPAPTVIGTLTATATPTTTPTVTPTPVTTTTTVAADADARVSESKPTTNYGSDTMLRTDSGSGAHVESYLRFDVPSFSGAVVKATLRLYVLSGTVDGPAVYAADNSWVESGITWATKPAHSSTASDDKSALSSGAWAEFNVTPLVSTYGAYSFALVGVSTDGVDFASKENTTTANRPQLVLTIDPDGPSAPTPTPLPTLVPTPTPLPGTHVIMAAGDMVCGADSTGAKCMQMQTAALLAPAEVVLPLGDVQYECGEPSDFTTYYNPSWGVYKDKSRPVVGNHEYNTSTTPSDKCYNNPPNAGGFFSYFGPLAGDPTQGYYSYDIGSWHMIALNTNCSKVGGCSSGTPQYKWLVADLAAHPAACTIAYMHHPAFSSGGIGNISYALPLWTPLYNAGADIVLAGHDHNYERFAPQSPSGALDNTYGIREFVVGTGGRNLSSMGSTKPNSQVRNNTTFGVLKLTLQPGSYQWQFLPIPGSSFTDSGSGNCHGAPGSASTSLSVAQITSYAGGMASGVSGNTLFPWFVLTGFVAAAFVWGRRRVDWRIR